MSTSSYPSWDTGGARNIAPSHWEPPFFRFTSRINSTSASAPGEALLPGETKEALFRARTRGMA